jgi:hypothetical protein
MEREEISHWFEEHPAHLHGDMREILSRCEQAVRRHAREGAWIAAKRYVETRRHEQRDELGMHASEAYVAREVCHRLAEELLRHEPVYEPGDETTLAGGPVKAGFDSEGWAVLVPWILEMAREEEHRTWLEITQYTDKLAKQLVRQHHLSEDTRFDHTKCYGVVAQEIERLLERDFSGHAFPH